MANLRDLKKEIDYRLEEFAFDCHMAIFVQPNKEEQDVELMQKGVVSVVITETAMIMG